jgi:hypothetical protein
MNNVDWINSAVRGAIPAIVVLSAILFRKWFPASTTTRNISWNSDELYERFKPLSIKAQLLLLVVMGLFAVSTWFILSRTNQLIASLNATQAIHLLPEPALWWFFPGFGALTCSWEITLQILGIFIERNTLDELNDWMNNNTRGWIQSRYTGMDARRVLRWMAICVALPILLFVLLALPMHANVGPDNIHDCGYAFKTCSVYSLADVVRVTEISGFRDNSGKLLNRAGLILDFKDSRRWSSAQWGDWKSTVDPALKEFVVLKTGLPLSYATTEKDIPPLR